MNFALWRQRDFRRLWFGQAISELGSRITREGIPLTAALMLNASPFQMGVLAAMGGGSVVFVSLLAGVWVDRLRRRPLLIGADLGRALILLSIPIAAYQHSLHMAQLYIVVTLTGILGVLFDVAYQTYVPDLVEREQLVEANSKLALSSSTAEVLGPALTGTLVQTITAPIAILLDAVSFLVSAFSVALIRKPEPPPAPHQAEPVVTTTVVGVVYMFRNPILRLFAARAMTAYFFGGFYGTLYLLYAVRYLHLSPMLLGIVVATGGGGSLIGAWLAERLGTRFGLGRMFLLSSVASGLAVLLVPWAHGTAGAAALFLIAQQLLGDAVSVVYFVNETSFRQISTPAPLLGRVNAGMQIVSRGVYPLGTLLGGVIAEIYGVRPALWIAGAGVLCSSLWLLGGPIRQLHRMPETDLHTLPADGA